MNIVLLANDLHPAHAVRDHIDAIARYSRNRVIVINPIANAYVPRRDIEAADAIVIHSSLYALSDWFLPDRVAVLVRDFRGVKAQIVQDEFRQVYARCEVMAELGINVIFTLVRESLVEKAYNHPKLARARKIPVLAGYVSDDLALRSVPRIAERPIDIGYRGRRLPYWLGALAQDKVRIAEGVLRLAPQYGLRCDVAVEEDERLYGDAWISFLCSCKAVLGTEGGASIWDYDGSVERAVEDYLLENRSATFEEVAEAVLRGHEGNMPYNTASPRVFEAAALRTPMIMFPGWYSGVVEPERHYIVLEKDFSNFAEVVRRLRDDDFLQALADQTYADLVTSQAYSKRAFAAKIDDALEAAVLEQRAPVEVRIDALPHSSRVRAPLDSVWTFIGRLWGRLYYPLALPVVLLRKLAAVLSQRRSTFGDRLLEVASLTRRLPNHVVIYRGSASMVYKIVASLCPPTATLLERCVRATRQGRALVAVALRLDLSIRAKRAEIHRLIRANKVKQKCGPR